MTTRVVVAIATYRRPERLGAALERLRVAASRLPSDWAAGVVVVDDDPAGSAREVAAAYAEAFALGCTYVACGSRNISTARNTGLDAVLGRAEWAGSIDDDVEVPEDWFDSCRTALASGPYDAVTGPLLKDFSAGPSWLAEQPFDQFGLMNGVEGEPADTCATGNSWVSTAFLAAHPDLRFDPALGLTGGEDMDFFYRALDRGLRPVYSRAAGVRNRTTARCTLRYQLRRAYWLGISEAQISLLRGRASRARLLARGVRRFANRGARTLPPEARPRRGARYTLAVWAQCLGVALGALGVKLRHS